MIDKVKRLATQRAWSKKNPNYQKELREKNGDKIRERDRKHYHKNIERESATSKKSREKNSDKWNENRRIKYNSDDEYRENKLQDNKDSYQKFKHIRNSQYSSYQQEWRNEHPENVLEWSIKSLTKQAKAFNLTVSAYKMTLASWSKVILKRDKVCVICGSTDRLNAHHIIHRAKIPALSFLLNNGIALCHNHHDEAHWKKIRINELSLS